ncbi:hypothetical protein TURU_037652 [Turdus rufiventris]|nr:hypothetical protein TURU_037652 [Turdus rufiventris]
MKRMAEKEGLNTGSAEEQPGVSPSCQQGNNVLGSSVATNITPHFKAPSNQSGWFGRAMALLPVSEGNGFIGGTHRDDEQYPNADLVSPGPDERALSFSTDDSITLGSCRTAIKS